MFYVHLEFSPYRSYYKSNNCIATGILFLGGNCYQKEGLLNEITSWQTKEQWISRLKESNGFFAIARYDEQNLWAAVDRVRSIPLFYGQKGQEFYLSDSTEWVRQRVGDVLIDPLAKEEFLLTGYVTGADTLFPSVKQIQPGELIHITKTADGVKLSTYRYYQYSHNYPFVVTEEELLKRYDEVLIKIFQRLIEVANGRTIVIPLSGGYDSRLIALMLKRLGYDKVIAFSYGRPGNRESSVSKQVADGLNIRWEFVPYTNELWYKWFHSEEMKAYYQMASGWSGIPHIQDWPAVWELKKKKIITEESIFVPGHSADLLAGSRSSHVSLYKEKSFFLPVEAPERIIRAILDYHYSLWDWKRRESELTLIFKSRILNSLGDLDKFPDGPSAFECWDIIERQAKFIVNSVRVYEFWGYKWWLPFWDMEYMRYWSNVPLKYRLREELHKRYIDGIFRNNFSLAFKYKQQCHSCKLFEDIRCLLSRIRIIKKLYNIYKILKGDSEYDKNPLAIYGLVEPQFFNKNYTGKENINSFLALDFLKKVEKNIGKSGF